MVVMESHSYFYYIWSNTKLAHARIMQRGGAKEMDNNISNEYLSKLRFLYEAEFLKKADTWVTYETESAMSLNSKAQIVSNHMCSI